MRFTIREPLLAHTGILSIGRMDRTMSASMISERFRATLSKAFLSAPSEQSSIALFSFVWDNSNRAANSLIVIGSRSMMAVLADCFADFFTIRIMSSKVGNTN